MPNSNNGTNPGDLLPQVPGNGEAANGASPGIMPAAPRALVAGAVAPLPTLSSTPTAMNLLRALRRRWLLATTLGMLAAAVTAVAIWFLLPAGKYMAFIRLYMPLRQQSILFKIDEQDFGSFQRTQFVMLRGRRVLDTALSSPGVKQMDLGPAAKSLSAADWLERQIKVEMPDGPELPRVIISGDEPALPKVLVTAVVDAYLDEVSANHQEHRQKRIDQLQKILDTYEARLRRLQETRNGLAKAAGAGSDKILLLQQELLQKQLAQAKSELVTVTADLRRWELEDELFQPREGRPAEVPQALINAQIEKDLEKEIDLRKKLEARLEHAKTVWDDPDHPTMKQYRRELEEKTKFIEEQRMDPRVHERVKADLLVKQKLNGGSNSALLKDKIAFNRQLGKLLQAEVERLQLEVRDLNRNAIDPDMGKIDLQHAEASVSLVKNELDKAIVELPAQARVRRYDDEAIVVFLDDTPRKLGMAILAGLAAIGVVLLIASVLKLPRGWGLDTGEETQGDEALPHGDHPSAPDPMGGTLLHPGEG